MNTLLLIQKSITFLTITLTLSMVPKQVMALPDIIHYSHQSDKDVGTYFFQSSSEKSIFSTIVYKDKEEEEKWEPDNNGKPKTSKGGGGR
ncbi:hypothetical protein ACP6PL_13530 [Dapis sp. BLCC M126]|uniref:hypothetical protein n=1 Tax=Dapis sp. BLCC M126 TaxID=3400189 RepID=UPI003CEEB820